MSVQSRTHDLKRCATATRIDTRLRFSGLPSETLRPKAVHFTLPDVRFSMRSRLFVDTPLGPHIKLSASTTSSMCVCHPDMETRSGMNSASAKTAMSLIQPVQTQICEDGLCVNVWSRELQQQPASPGARTRATLGLREAPLQGYLLQSAPPNATADWKRCRQNPMP